jgi:SAM-dependent methyltransferase
MVALGDEWSDMGTLSGNEVCIGEVIDGFITRSEMKGAGISADDQAKIDEVWGDPSSWQSVGEQWTALTAVRRHNNRDVTGDEALDPLSWFFRRVEQERSLPLPRVLVLACGGGSLERQLVGCGWASEVVAVDISSRAVAAAEAEARRLGLTGIHYQTADMNALDVEGPFDAIFSVAALHHCENLESAFESFNRLLRPEGWLYLDEYVGPNRLQWSDAQVLAVNRFLQILPDPLVVNAKGYSRRGFYRASAAEVIAMDPSEAPRSADILRIMHQYMSVEVLSGYGGGLLHLVLANLAQNFTSEESGCAAAEYLDLLIAASHHLSETGRAWNQFAVAVVRPGGRVSSTAQSLGRSAR